MDLIRPEHTDFFITHIKKSPSSQINLHTLYSNFIQWCDHNQIIQLSFIHFQNYLVDNLGAKIIEDKLIGYVLSVDLKNAYLDLVHRFQLLAPDIKDMILEPADYAKLSHITTLHTSRLVHFENLPNLTKLVINLSKIPIFIIPPTITQFQISRNISSKIKFGRTNLVKLDIRFFYGISERTLPRPPTLKELVVWNRIDLQPGFLPSGLESYISQSTTIIRSGSFPSSVRKIFMNHCIIEGLMTADIFPANLETLEFGDVGRTPKMRPGILPINLINLYLCDYKYRIKPGFFPPNLKDLSIDSSNEETTLDILPANLESFDGTINMVGRFPQSVTCINLPNNNSNLTIDNIPPNLEKLTVCISNQIQCRLPMSLRYLEISGNCNLGNLIDFLPIFLESLKTTNVTNLMGTLPDIYDLHLNEIPFETVFKPGFFPNSLVNLTIIYGQKIDGIDHTIQSGILPPNLQSLNIRNYTGHIPILPDSIETLTIIPCIYPLTVESIPSNLTTLHIFYDPHIIQHVPLNVKLIFRTIIDTPNLDFNTYSESKHRMLINVDNLVFVPDNSIHILNVTPIGNGDYAYRNQIEFISDCYASPNKSATSAR